MSKSNLGHELLQDQLITAEELLTQRSSESVSKTKRDRDSVLPFAKDMIDNVVTGALSILEISRKEGKPWKDVLAATKNRSGDLSGKETVPVDKDDADFLLQGNRISNTFSLTDTQRPVVQVMHLQVGEDVVCDSFHAEQVAKIVKGLQDIQIGDSAYVLPTDGSNIEKQVKRAVRNINSLELGDMETAQLIICDGQGDVHATILEAELQGPPSNASSKAQHDSSKISTRFLHKMIEELEDNYSTEGNSPDHGNKEGIAIWEESEEKFIRIIEGPGDYGGGVVLENQEDNRTDICDEESLVLGAENDVENRDFQDFSGRREQAFRKEEVIATRENGNRPKNIFDIYTDEETYCSTPGLIPRVVTRQESQVLPRKTTIIGKESRTPALEGNLQVIGSGISIQESLSVGDHGKEKTEAKGEEESDLKCKKKKSFGTRLRKFFLRFKRRKDC